MIEPTDAAPAAKAMLADKARIAAVRAHYWRCMDTRDWDGMRDVFTRDAVMDMRPEVAMLAELGLPISRDGGLIEGRAAIIAAMRRSLEATVTVHHGHMPEIEVLSADRARAIWAFEDIVTMPPGAPCRRLHGYGHYHDRYAREEGRWRLSFTTISRLLVELG